MTDGSCEPTKGLCFMGKFDGVLFCTDLDGTLLRRDQTVSRENREAIAYFQQNGGLFTFITGRMPIFAKPICEAVHPNAPFGCVNGGGLFDPCAGKYVWQQELTKDVMPLITYIEENVPHIGIQLNTFEETYICRDHEEMHIFEEIAGRAFPTTHYTAIAEPFAKVLFAGDVEDVFKTQALLSDHPLSEKFDFIRSDTMFYEILPKGLSKGSVLRELQNRLPVRPTKTIVIGDYYNDLSMFAVADVSVAVGNACDAAKEAASFVTVSNEEHAIARVIYDL